jgi:hypothetical protein
MRWDIFCKVIDNHGDAGVCWRLAAELAARGERCGCGSTTRRRCDWMAPEGRPGVAGGALDPAPPPRRRPATRWSRPSAATRRRSFVARMAAGVRPPAWINLEYLSAEAYRRAQPRAALAGVPGAGRRADQALLLSRLHAAHRRPAARARPAARRAASTARRGWLRQMGRGGRATKRLVSACSATSRPRCRSCCAAGGRPGADPPAGDRGPRRAGGAGHRWRAPGWNAPARRLRCTGCRCSASANSTTCCGPATSTSCAARTPWCAPAGRRAVRLADLSAGRRRAPRQARRLARLARRPASLRLFHHAGTASATAALPAPEPQARGAPCAMPAPGCSRRPGHATAGSGRPS